MPAKTALAALVLALVSVAAQPAPVAAEPTKNCPAGTIDTLDWMTLDANLRGSRHMRRQGGGGHPLYTVVWPDKFYWLKTDQGDTWDIQLYDNNWIYLWITENEVFHEPYNYKKFYYNFNVPLAPRCAIPGYPGVVTRIYNTAFVAANSCVEGPVQNLRRALTEFWGPYTAGQPGLESTRTPIGGTIPDSTEVYTVAWRWSCNDQFTVCDMKEEYILTQRYGLVRWNLWRWQNGRYVLQNQTTFNQLRIGAVNPFFPCF